MSPPRSESPRRLESSGGAFQEGHNCWRITHAEGGRFLVDGSGYFSDLHRELLRAKRTICISGWDIDSRLELLPEARVGKGRSGRLLNFLNDLALRNPGLEIYILIWDPAPVYYAERESFTGFKFKWRSHPRIHFRRDGDLPVGASQHRKLVIIDDRIAYCGGIDLTANRWDSPRHGSDDDRRTNPWGRSYGPFHDVQIRVNGAAARDLGDLFRDRWGHVGGETIGPSGTDPVRSFPEGPSSRLSFGPAPVAIARTEPSFRGGLEVREIETLYLDLIATARRFIYLENQFLSSGRIAAALARLLQKERGPEILIVIPASAGNVMEEVAMRPFQNRVIETLREADRFSRLMIAAPVLESGREVMVHSKVAVFDDAYAMVGSANLANRSMGMDFECNVVIDGKGSREVAAVIDAFRSGLIAEHTGTGAEGMRRVSRELASGGSVLKWIRERESLRDGRRLVSTGPDPGPSWIREVIPEIEIVNLEHSIEDEAMVEDFAYDRHGRFGRFLRSPVVYAGFIIGLLLFGIVLIWTFTPLREWMNVDVLAAEVERFVESPFAPLWVLLVYLAGGLLFVPVNLLILATATVFDVPAAIALSSAGSLVNAAGGYTLGSALGYRVIDRIFGQRIRRLGEKFSRKGILPVVAIRMLPIAPYSVVNLIAGAGRISPRNFFIGTFLGLMPGILTLVLLQRSLISFLRAPSIGRAALFAGLAALFGWALFVLKRRFFRRDRQ